MQIHFPHARRVVYLFMIGVILSGCIRLPATGGDDPRGAETQRGADDQRSRALPDGPRVFPRKTVVASAQASSPARVLESTVVLEPACVAGDWQVSDLAGVLRSAYEESQHGQALSLDRVEGQVRYRFDPSGSVEIGYQQVAVSLSGSLDGQPVAIQQVLDGAASARYVVETAAGSLAVTDFRGEGVQYRFDINGQRLAEGSFPAWRVFAHALSGRLARTPSPLVRYARLAATCGEETLILRPVEPFDGPQVELERVDD